MMKIGNNNMAPQPKKTEGIFTINNLFNLIITCGIGIIINNQWEMKEWKGSKDQLDRTQSADIILLRSDFTLMGHESEKTKEDVIEIKAALPKEEKKRKRNY